ncbi:hypothetical protein M2375_000938 [Comamonas sp. BIGb0152]|uniref:Ig-like domain-containing protein n=1 Tax=Comamonas sp. BIGb0152 TaxID=2940601 RepID=UPI002169651A|nr:Ig-like domain-containing protein [Comamonas sp. BIGb0152]MCS4292732.1 hypothetical protein [Comamonas sp. BIGb0152]
MNLFKHADLPRSPRGNKLSKWISLMGMSLFALGSAHAGNIAYWSDAYSDFPAPAVAAANTVTNVSASDIDAGALQSYDVLIVGHIYSNTATTCTQVSEFLAAGKGMISEWNAATLLFQPAPDASAPVSTPCNLFAGTASGGDPDFGTNLPLQIVDAASPLVAGLPNPFSMAGGSEFVYQLTGIGAEWSVAATFDGAGTIYPAVISAAPVTGGCIALSPFDYFDAGFEGGTALSNMEILMGNMVNWVARGSNGCGAVPPPALADDAVTASRSQPTTINVISNDEAGVTLDTTYTLALSDPAAGALTYSGSQIVFTPTSSFTAPVTFVYQACNTASLCSTATVTITPQAIAPVAPTPVPTLGGVGLLLLSGVVAGSMGLMRRRKSN